MRASMLRRFEKAEEAMMRAAMPRTSAADPAVRAARVLDAAQALRPVATKTLTFKLAEVAR